MKPKKLKRIPLKEELVVLTGDYKLAIVLQQMIYWNERCSDFDKFIEEENKRKDENKGASLTEKTNGWIYKKAAELSQETLMNVSAKQILRYLKKLEENGWIESRNNPKYKWDKTLQYRLNLVKLMTDLNNIGYQLEGYAMFKQNPKTKGNPEGTRCHFKETESDIQSGQDDGAIPEITTEITTKITTDTVGAKSDNTENLGKDKDSVPDKTGKKDSVSDNLGKGIEDTPNSYTVSVDDSFLREYVEKNKEKDFRSVSLCETLLNRAESMEFPAPDNIGNVDNFKDKLFRFRRKYEKGEISGALELYQALPINSYHRQNMTDYINHEWQKWDFSNTKNENTVKGQFILEYILWHPVYAHFKSVKQQGLLAQDIANYSKRNQKPKKQESHDSYFDPELEEEFKQMLT
jgi:hypothetical protein